MCWMKVAWVRDLGVFCFEKGVVGGCVWLERGRKRFGGGWEGDIYRTGIAGKSQCLVNRKALDDLERGGGEKRIGRLLRC